MCFLITQDTGLLASPLGKETGTPGAGDSGGRQLSDISQQRLWRGCEEAVTAGVGALRGKPTGAGVAAASASFGPWGTQRCRTPSVVGPLQGPLL